MKSASSQNLTKEEVFRHLVYEYRCLATSAHAWTRFGDPKSTDGQKQDANQLIPEVGTVIQDSLLLHTRTLIEFYWPSNPQPTDITHSYFSSVNGSKYKELRLLKRPIDVHIMHLTAWRDPLVREGVKDVERPDFNKINGQIFSWLVDALKELSTNLTNPWGQALKSLCEASRQRFEKGVDYDWPSCFGEIKLNN